MERKRKMQHTGSQGSNTRFHVGSLSQGPVFRPGQQSGQPRVQAACHTPFRERGNEASIRVPRMFKSHVQ
jgi:hypothetical protein